MCIGDVYGLEASGFIPGSYDALYQWEEAIGRDASRICVDGAFSLRVDPYSGEIMFLSQAMGMLHGTGVVQNPP